MKKIISIIIIALLFVINISAQNRINHTYTLTDGPDKNPMKGWNSGWWDNFDLATVGFQYLKWNVFEPTDGNFDFSAVESIINRSGSAGKHIILRLYTDWFGNDQTSDAGPQWLYSDYGVERLQAPNGKYITNYNNTNYITQVNEAINALANEYDNDPRIYTIQLGVLGYWGEWHTYSFDDPNFEIEDATAMQILNTYESAFQNKKLMGRYPWREPLASVNTIGFHNDFFKPNNEHSDEFDDAILADNKWLQGPIGGEIPPINNSEQFMTDLYETTTGMNMVETGHYSTMKVGSNERPCASNANSQKCQGFMSMHRKMGYNFQIESALFAENLSQSDNLVVDLNILNIGVAAMYYDWSVQFALLDENSQAIKTFEIAYNLKTVLPSTNTYTITMSEALNTVSIGNYQLAVRLIQPGADTSKTNVWSLNARNTYILFSNEMEVIDGQWDTNNALIGGWSVLGSITINDSTLSINDNRIEDSIKIHPNPAENELNIIKKEGVLLKTIQLYDITGRLIKSINLENMPITKTIDITNLSTGIYNLIINSENSQIQKRFIKQ